MKTKSKLAFYNYFLMIIFIASYSCNADKEHSWDLDKKNAGQKTFILSCGSCHMQNESGNASIYKLDVTDFSFKMRTIETNKYLHRNLTQELSKTDIENLVYYIKFKQANKVNIK